MHQGLEGGAGAWHPVPDLVCLHRSPLCTREQLYQSGVLNRSPGALWGS